MFEPVQVKQQWVGGYYRVKIVQPAWYYLISKCGPQDASFVAEIMAVERSVEPHIEIGRELAVTESFPAQKGVPITRHIIRWRDA